MSELSAASNVIMRTQLEYDTPDVRRIMTTQNVLHQHVFEIGSNLLWF